MASEMNPGDLWPPQGLRAPEFGGPEILPNKILGCQGTPGGNCAHTCR